ncbi:MAG TPA: rhombosortase [Candidatus Polarisedimenticolia bacterium]|nr:rhombosortase [Candidatus Polarisedimenticolia bacterium]
MKRVPWITLCFVLVCAVAGAMPGGSAALEYRQVETAAGEWWRPVTGQLVHWTTRMTIADLGAVAILGALLERRSRCAAGLAIAGALVFTGLGLHWLPPAMHRYRGASSVASGLFVALALDLGLARGATPLLRFVALAAAGLFVTKVGVEAGTGQALFAGAMGPGVRVSPRAHLLGALGGVVGFWVAAAGAKRSDRPAGGG